MNVDLIIDGNYILSRLVFTLHKNNLLFGALHKSLENAINKYRRWYPYSNVYLVSDSKEKSWRKDFISEYKSTRKKDSDIDWNFVYTAYSEVKETLPKYIKILEAPNVEGDDWISFLVKEANKNQRSTMIISNDYDIKQLVEYKLDPLYMNFMVNEMYNKEKLFLPNHYNIFMDKIKSLPNNDLFNLNYNKDFIKMMDGFMEKSEIVEINAIETLLIKIISGDTSDNIQSVWVSYKNGKKRGIGDKGAKYVYDKYEEVFGNIDLKDPDLYENIADLICEKKKLAKSNIESIVENIKHNTKLIDLDLKNLPDEILKKMSDGYTERNSLKLI